MSPTILNGKSLICTENVFGKPLFEAGGTYKVVNESEDMIALINEAGEMDHYSKDPESPAYFGKRFKVNE